ncbi:MAG: hypothetical protein IPM58_18180 [Nitrospira sp.]|nr:hypothetical protein [Nitrospira sp.]
MGRRRQHNGDLALSSDQIPGRAKNNIRPGLVTLDAGLARPFANRQWDATPDRKKRQA